MSTTVASLGEDGVIERLMRVAPAAATDDDVVLPNGDDAAVVRLQSDQVLTTDDLVEDVHFRRSGPGADACRVGRKLVAVNASDLAAMGAEPRFLLLNLILPQDLLVSWLDAFADGLDQACRRDGLRLVGGNVSRSPGPVVLSATAVGVVPAGAALPRHGARDGDDIWVSVGAEGGLGAARAGLECLEAGNFDPEFELLRRAQQDPVPRVALGSRLRGQVRAACDASDGLSRDLRRMLAGQGCVIEVARLPIPDAVRVWAARAGRAAAAYALAGGEEYELVAVAPPEQRRSLESLAVEGVRLVRVGRVQGTTARWVGEQGDGELPLGFTHFEPGDLQ